MTHCDSVWAIFTMFWVTLSHSESFLFLFGSRNAWMPHMTFMWSNLMMDRFFPEWGISFSRILVCMVSYTTLCIPAYLSIKEIKYLIFHCIRFVVFWRLTICQWLSSAINARAKCYVVMSLGWSTCLVFDIVLEIYCWFVFDDFLNEDEQFKKIVLCSWG